MNRRSRMSTWSLPVIAIALTLITPTIPALAASPAQAPAATRSPLPTATAKIIPGLTASDAVLNTALEERCIIGIETNASLCEMTFDDISTIRGQIKASELELHDIALRVMKPRIGELDAQPRSAASVASAIANIAKLSKNPLVNKLADQANKFADFASRATTGAAALTQSNTLEYAKAAVFLAASFVPPLGDILALGDSIHSRDFKGVAVAVIGLTATAIGLTFPPAGAVIAVSLALYALGDFLWNYFRAKSRDWIANPPATAEELFRSGASMKWEAHMIKGRPVNLVFQKNAFLTTQTLLLNSKWTDRTQHNREPVTYTLEQPKFGYFYNSNVEGAQGMSEVVLGVWQDGQYYTDRCHTSNRVGELYVQCNKLAHPITISSKKSAVLKVGYIYGPGFAPDNICRNPPCVASGLSASVLTVLSEGKVPVKVLLPFVPGRL